MPATKKKATKPALLSVDEIIEMAENLCAANGVKCLRVNETNAADFYYVRGEKAICCNELAIGERQEGAPPKHPITAEVLNLILLHELGHHKDIEENGLDYYECAGKIIKMAFLDDLKFHYYLNDNTKARADVAANYYHLPVEKRANDIMGLDFRKLVYNNYGFYPSKKWQSNPANTIVNLEIPRGLCQMVAREAGRLAVKRKGSGYIDYSWEIHESLKKRSVKYIRFLLSAYSLFMPEEADTWSYDIPQLQERLGKLTEARKKACA
jgi:hypothetical protein